MRLKANGYQIYLTCLYVVLYLHKSLYLTTLHSGGSKEYLSIHLHRVDLRFQLNLTRVQRFGNAHVTRFCSTNTRVVMYLRGHIQQDMTENKIEK